MQQLLLFVCLGLPLLWGALGVTSAAKTTALTYEPLRELWSSRAQGQHEGND